jgi:acylphosphatase
MESRRIIIKGKVQGVGYRYYVLKIANDLNLCGFVRNCSDGKVEIEAEGDSISINTLIDFCHVGPPRAIINGITSQSQPIVGYTTFQIR